MRTTQWIVGAYLLTALVAVAATPTATADHGPTFQSCQMLEPPFNAICLAQIVAHCEDVSEGNPDDFEICLRTHGFPV